MPNVYEVGGCVRDSFLGVKSKDIDLAVEGLPNFDAFRAYIVSTGAKIYQERPEFVTIRGTHPTLKDVDYVMCRADGEYSDGRRPDSVTLGSIIDDLSRRDFTVNAIARNVATGGIIDPFNGQQDIENRVLRCVGEPLDRFTEDVLRVFRALRFSLVKGFTMTPETVEAIQAVTYRQLETLPDERVLNELEKMFAFDTRRAIGTLLAFPTLFNFAFERGIRLIPSMKGVK